MTFPCRILFLDDHIENVRSMQVILQKAGLEHSTNVVNIKSEVISTIKSFKPNMVIMNHAFKYGVNDLYVAMKRHAPDASLALLADRVEDEEVNFNYNIIDDYLLRSDLHRLPFLVKSIIRTQELKQEVLSCRKEQRLLYENSEKTREEEKLRISRELHDEIGQVLTALKIDLKLLGKRLFTDDSDLYRSQIESEFQDTLKAVDNTMATVRKIATGLRPDILDKLGLLEAIEWQAEEILRKHGISCQTDLPKELELPNDHYTIALFRIVQETLTNVVKHANASEVVVALKQNNDRLNLLISDNGKGITTNEITKAKSLGLVGLRERVNSLNGQLAISGSKERGTEVSVNIPIDTHLMNEKV